MNRARRRERITVTPEQYCDMRAIIDWLMANVPYFEQESLATACAMLTLKDRNFDRLKPFKWCIEGNLFEIPPLATLVEAPQAIQ